MAIYYHVVIDKNNVGVAHLRNQLALHGLQTQEQRGMPPGYPLPMIAMQHHQHVFLWDGTTAGVRGRRGIENGTADTVTVLINWPELTESGRFIAGTLKGDSAQYGPPQGPSTNGAWAYKGSIDRRWIFIEGLDTASDPGFDQWQAGQGWP
ncbi:MULTISPECIES: hypothetical protein [unclassified Luteibacter]|uniref:hypothetical protein n=1 Tax=unclassified Luteibacter TaxID=2620188 RepID=UPI0008D6C54B|nr:MULTISPECIES: hypothetical protein [unclassified Luteibacter]MDR6934900.1 hypothetical protein [Luteibacter sp. 3190]SEO84427.1 hypothetical protein SAMN02800692_2481 [Luteibacter sp. UNC138MFCol5.1]SEW01644.1 hypothetical protein SAMN04515660_1808 [Luteibacter sp. 329MFSha]